MDRVVEDPIAHRHRQATEIALHAIARFPSKRGLYLKGGLLMALVHGSPRSTTDIDLTADFAADEGIARQLHEELDRALRSSVVELGYRGIAIKVHGIKESPRNLFPAARVPALEIKLVHSVQSKRGKEQRLYFCMEISFHEIVKETTILELPLGHEIHTYSLTDLMAEKFRAVLQQVPRKRNRSRDIFDLSYLIGESDFDASERHLILSTMTSKSRSRGIEPSRDSLENPEIRRRSEVGWTALALEIGSVPEFFQCFEQVRVFYESLFAGGE